MRQMNRAIYPRTGHVMWVGRLSKNEALALRLERAELFETFYVVRNWDKDGVVFFYLAKGLLEAPKQVCGWYPNTHKMWASYGLTIELAVHGMMDDGWKYA